MRKMNHFIRIRAQNWIWRPVEPPQCLLGTYQTSQKSSKIAIFRYSSLSILTRITYFDKQKFLRHISSWNFPNLRRFGRMTNVGSGEGSQSSPSAIFEHFPKPNIFDILDFPRKLTICPNDLGRTRESLSRLDLSIPYLDMPPTHAGNRTFCVKKRDFRALEQNSKK